MTADPFQADNGTPTPYQVLFDSHPQPMWVYDLCTLGFVAVNAAAIAHYGYSRGEFLGMTIKDIRPPDDWRKLEDNLSHVNARLQRSGDWRHRLKDGRIILVEIWSDLIDFDGREARLVIANDVTEQRSLERKIQESEERFRAVAHVTTDVIWDWSLKEDKTWYSEGLEKVFGYSPEEGNRGSDFWVDHIHQDDRERVLRSTENAIAERKSVWEDQYRFLRKDGSVAHVEDCAYLIYDAEGNLLRLVGGMSDISARKLAQAKLAQQAELLDMAQDAIIVHDIDHRVLFWNQGAERVYGWSMLEALNRPVPDLLLPDPGQFRQAADTTLARGQWSGALTLHRKDATGITVEASWTLVRDDTGKPSSILAIETDVTKRLALEEQLRQSQRLEAIGQLTGGVAHDFNNLLTVILGNAELLVEQLQENEPVRLLAEMTMSAARRGAELTQRLLAFSRRQPLAPKTIDVNTLLADMDGLLRRTINADVRIRMSAGTNVGCALVDPSQLETALLNLCINARDAMPKGGQLTIETEAVALDDEYVEEHIEVAAGEYILVAISDTGTGIAPEVLSRVFEPFFTTKDVGKGTGLGLSMVYGFARQSGGHVKLYSEVGEGTTVKLYLPKVQILEERTTIADRSTAAGGHGETILVVEDERLVRYHVQSQLEALGYHVVTVADAREALKEVGRGGRLDLLFTDIMMPGGMNGKQLADAVRVLRPGLPVLYTSGYAEAAIVHQGRLDTGVSLLSKPYSRADLARKVLAALSIAE